MLAHMVQASATRCLPPVWQDAHHLQHYQRDEITRKGENRRPHALQLEMSSSASLSIQASSSSGQLSYGKFLALHMHLVGIYPSRLCTPGSLGQ